MSDFKATPAGSTERRRRTAQKMKAKSSPSAAAPALPWRTKIQLFLLSVVTDAVRRPNGTVNRRVLSLLDPAARPNANPVRGVRSEDVAVDPTRDLWFRLYLPAPCPSDEGRLPVFVFFHGGGFAYLSPASQAYDAVCRRFCRKLPAAVLSVNYRRSPEHRCPAPYDDGVHVLRFLASRGGSVDPPAAGSRRRLLREFLQVADLSCCIVAGDSAGANIAHHVARRWSAGEAPGDGSVALAGVLAIQPFFGGEKRAESELRLPDAPVVNIERTDWLWKAFLPEGADRDHEAASPCAAAAGLGESFPPVMVVVGGFDPLQDWQRMYCEGLRKAGREARLVEYPGAFHAFYLFPETKESPALMEEVKGFVEEQQKRQRHRRNAGGGEDGAPPRG